MRHVDWSQRERYVAMLARELAGDSDRLPFKTYQEYLNSALWWGIRAKIMKRADDRCACCEAEAEDVHHRSYGISVLKGRALGQLVAICRACHEQAEWPNGKKGTTAEANTWIDERIAKRRAAGQQTIDVRYPERLAASIEMVLCQECRQPKRPRDFPSGSAICGACRAAER